MSVDLIALRTELESLADPKHKAFTEKLIPGCNNVLGLRMPMQRKIAKRIAKSDSVAFLQKKQESQDLYFEEVMIEGLVIGQIKEVEQALHYAKHFIPKINNWAHTDSFCGDFKIAKKHQAEVWAFIPPYLRSTNTYDVRVAVVMMLFHFINDEYIDKHFAIYDAISHDDYYVKMAVAWAVSMCFVKYPQQTMAYLKDNQLDNDTYNKALQKIRESLRVDKETTALIKTMKR